jgi:hypothetical protein
MLGDAYIVISPDTRLFGTMTEAQIRKAIAGINPNVRVGADTKGATRAILSFQARLKALSDALGKMRLDVKEDKAGAARIAALQGKVFALAKSMSSMTIAGDTKKLDAQIAAKLAQVKDLRLQLSSLQADANTKAAAAKIASLQAEAFHLQESLSSGKLKAAVDITKAETRLKAIDADLRVLASNARAVKLAADNSSLLKAISVARGELAGLQKQAADVRLGANVDPAKLLAAESTLLGYEAALEKLTPAVQTGDVALGALGKAITGTGTGWGFLNRDIALFGGAFNRVLPVIASSIKVWHVLADVIIEIAAVWIPAGLAVGAFAVAASDAAKEIVNRMNAVHTVMDATGRSVAPMTNAMENLHKAVRPQVYQLFGDALTVMNSRTGTFAQVAKKTGTVVDQLAARMVYALTSSNKLGTSTNQLSGFWRTAITDVSKLGDSIGNLFGIFGNLFRALPGFAAGLLTIGDDFTKILETASAAAVPLLKWVLLLHGYVLYTGLAVTATLAFIGGVANLAKQFFTFAAGSVLAGVGAIKSFVNLLKTGALFVYDFVTAIAALIAEEGILIATQELLAAVNPLVWVGAAVVALGALVFWMNTSKDAAQQFNDSMQKTITNASLVSLQSTLQQGAAQTAAKLAGANHDLNKALSQQGPAVTGAATRWSSNYSPAVDHAARSVLELTAGQRKIADQAALVGGRIGALSKQYGGNTQALGALVAAGITSAQITDTNKDKWAQALIQVNSTTQAYQAMGTQAGVLGNDLDVLGRTVTDQYKAVQTLNQGWSAFIADVTGSQGSFDTVAQGFVTLADHSSKLNFSLGKLKVSYKDANVAIDSLTPAGIALNQAFGDQVVNVDKLFASWRTAGLAGNLFTAGVKDAIAPLVKYAAGSREATAQLVALAQEAGYQGPISMAALTKWLGNTHGATQKLKDITNQATTQEALLTGAMQAQGNYVANTLLRDINNAILKYNGVEKAATAYGNAVARSGAQSDAAHQARARLITDIIRSGTAAHDSTGQIAAMITKVLGIPPKEALQIVMTGTGSFSLSQINAKTGKQQQAARGLFVTGGTPGQDSVAAMLMPGEVVVPTAMVNAGAVDHLRGMLPGFAGGGLVNRGNLDVLSGQYAVNEHNAFKTSMTNSMVSMMRTSLKAAESAAQAAAAAAVGGVGVAGPGGGAPAANAALARKMMPAWGSGAEWAAWNTLMMHESGWNQFARNPSSGAYGIPQALPPGKMGAAANPPQSNPAAQISWMIGYIRSAYGDPIRAWAQYYAHPGGVGYYAKGGLAGYAKGGRTGYAKGGPARKMAAGGQIPLAKYLPQLKAAQANEFNEYAGLRKAYLTDLAHARKGSWTSGHKAGIRSELGTLAKRQSAEEAGYDNILHHGTAKANLAKLASRVKAVATTSRDKDLSHSHPGWTHGLQHWLGVLSHLSSSGVAPPSAGTQASSVPAAWARDPDLAALAAAAQAEAAIFWKLNKSALPKQATTAQRKALAAWDKALEVQQLRTFGMTSGTKGWWGSGPGLFQQLMNSFSNGKTPPWGAFGSAVDYLILEVEGTGIKGGINPPGAPANSGYVPWHYFHGQWQALLNSLRAIPGKLTAAAPWKPGNLGASHTVSPGVLKFDTGRGVLPPGLSLSWNGTGRGEALSSTGAGGPSEIHLHVHNNGVIGSQQQTDAWLQASLNRMARTGYLTNSVNRAQGR